MTKNTKEQPEDECDTSMAERGRAVLAAIRDIYGLKEGGSAEDDEEAITDALTDMQHALTDRVNVEEIGSSARKHYLYERDPNKSW